MAEKKKERSKKGKHSLPLALLQEETRIEISRSRRLKCCCRSLGYNAFFDYDKGVGNVAACKERRTERMSENTTNCFGRDSKV